MSFFCLLWIPLFYLLRRASLAKGASSGSVWALLLGSITAIFQFFLGNIITPGGFGFSRWLFGLIDIICIPVIIPFFIYLFIIIFRGVSDADFANFTLLWLIPVAGIHALGWSSGSDPVLLIMVPMLWSALGMGISFFIHWMIKTPRWYSIIISIICISILPFLAAGAYWAFFSQQTLIGFALFSAVHIPFVLSLVINVFR